MKCLLGDNLSEVVDHYWLHLVLFIYKCWSGGASVFSLNAPLLKSLLLEEREKYDCIAVRGGYCNSVMKSNLVWYQGLTTCHIISFPAAGKHSSSSVLFVIFFLFLSFSICVCCFCLLPSSPYQFTGSRILFVQRNRHRKKCGGYQTICRFAQVSVDVPDSCSLLDIFC